MKNKEPYSYTEGDIRRYHSGAMPEGERHLLERAALEDPFLADALEGYGQQPAAEGDLPALRRAIGRRISPAPVRRMPYLAAAAVLLLVAAGAWWLLPREGAEGPAVAQTRPAPLPEQPRTESSGGDTVTPGPQASAATGSAPQREVARSQPPARRQASAKEVAGLADIPDTTYLTAPLPETRPAVVLKSTIRGDSLGTIVLQPQQSELQEIVIGNTTARRKTTPSPAAAAVAADTLEPMNGWTDFEAYVVDRLASEPARKDVSLRGTVRLSFELNSDGAPINIRVEESLCPSCDEAAIRLLKEGPKWKKRTRNRARIGIRF